MASTDIPPSAAMSEAPARQFALRHRQKRSQVARACDGCRLQRIKCDNSYPCTNCQTRNRPCSNSDTSKTSTLAQAHDEIGRLRSRIQELEARLRHEHDNHQQLTPPHTSPSDASRDGRVDCIIDGSKHNYWEGIHLRPARSPNESWYGPSSLYYYIHRLNIFLSSALQEARNASNMLLVSESSSKLLERSTVDSEALVNRIASSAGVPAPQAVYLNPVQEGYFINLFWETYHTSVLPIVDEAEFKKHYQSLYVENGSSRKPSALVDIIVAMCMQFGISNLPSDQQGSIAENNDPTVAGRWHYRRAQMLLTFESESPTTSTLQCHLLCALYLCGGSFHNMVDISCALAVRTAYILGLHLDADKNVSEWERQMRRRLWWAVYLMDSKVGLKLGRPFLINDKYHMPELPGDQFDAAMVSGSTFAPIGQDSTWLSFNLHQTKLYMKIRAAHIALYSKRAGSNDEQKLWENWGFLEELAELVSPHTRELERWANDVPSTLKMCRLNNGQTFSTDGTRLIIEQFAPLWLQRQRILLELTYHNLCINLYRPFVSFISVPAIGSSAEQTATRCAAHAIALSKALHQVVSSTPILNGWHEAFQWQWGATMTLLGFLLMYPRESTSRAARDAVDLSISVFDIFGASFSVAANAGQIARDVLSKVDSIVANARAQNDVLGNEWSVDTDITINGQVNMINPGLLVSGSTTGPAAFEDTGMEFNMFDMALDIDFWADYDTLWPAPGQVF